MVVVVIVVIEKQFIHAAVSVNKRRRFVSFYIARDFARTELMIVGNLLSRLNAKVPRNTPAVHR